LIWGDNNLSFPLSRTARCVEEIEKQGGLKLIYIDPPFDVGADFSMDIEIGGDTFTRNPTSSKKSPTVTPGAKARIALSP